MHTLDHRIEASSNKHKQSKNYIDGFNSMFSLWQLEGRGSCVVDIDQSAGTMVM